MLVVVDSERRAARIGKNQFVLISMFRFIFLSLVHFRMKTLSTSAKFANGKIKVCDCVRKGHQNIQCQKQIHLQMHEDTREAAVHLYVYYVVFAAITSIIKNARTKCTMVEKCTVYIEVALKTLILIEYNCQSYQVKFYITNGWVFNCFFANHTLFFFRSRAVVFNLENKTMKRGIIENPVH